MKTYPTYDATGIKWNPTKPSHWEQWRGKRFFYSQKVKNIGNEEKNILSLTLKGVIRNSADRPIGLSPSDYSTYQIFEKDDLVFKLIDLNNISTSRVGLVPERGIMSSAYIRLTARHECNIRYFFLQYYDLWLRNIYNGLGAGVRQTLSVDDLLALDVVIPPREEQDQIVCFLDWKVSEINRLINIKHKEIARLEELKKGIISRVVTKGLDSSVPKRIITGNWMGEIPEHWRMIPSKRLFQEGKEKKRLEDQPATASQKYGIILQSDFMEKENRRIVVATQGLEEWKHVEPNNFVISLRSFQGGIEWCEISGCVTWHYIVLIPQKNVYPPYFKWLLKSPPYINALQRTSDFIRDGQDLRFSHFIKVDLPLIPIDEQKAIADFLNAKIPQINEAIENKKKQISSLHEFKTRLISDVVTGKIDVRGIEIPEYEYTAEEADNDSEAEAEELDEGGEEE